MGTWFSVAIRNLVQARRRTALLFVALFAVSLLLILLLSVSQGMTDTMLRSATTLYTGHVNVAGFYKAKASDAFPLISDTEKLRKLVAENVDDLDYMIDRSRGWAKLVSATSSLYAGPSGIDAKEEGKLFEQVRMAKQSAYKEGGSEEILGDPTQLSEPNTIMIFAAQAKRLEIGIGDMVTLSSETMGGTTNTLDVRVVAIADDIGFFSSWNCYVSKQTLATIYDTGDNVSGAIHIYLNDPSKAAAVMGNLREVFADADYTLMDHEPSPFWQKFETVAGEDWLGQKLDITTWKDEVGMLTWAISALDSIAFFLVAIMLVIIVVGIVNTMLIAVRERTSEIGTLRAIGMHRRQVLRLFLLEAALLGLAGASLGSLAGAGTAWLITALNVPVTVEALRAILMSDTLNMVVQPQQLIGTIVMFTLVCAAAAFWPAVLGARLQPVTAIHRAE